MMLLEYLSYRVFVTLAILHRVEILLALVLRQKDIILTKGNILSLKIVLNFLIVNVFIFMVLFNLVVWGQLVEDISFIFLPII